MSDLAVLIAGASNVLPLVLPVLWSIVVCIVIVSIVTSFLLVWALVSLVIARSSFVASYFVFVGICQGCFMPIIFGLITVFFSAALDLSLFMHHIY